MGSLLVGGPIVVLVARVDLIPFAQNRTQHSHDGNDCGQPRTSRRSGIPASRPAARSRQRGTRSGPRIFDTGGVLRIPKLVSAAIGFVGEGADIPENDDINFDELVLMPTSRKWLKAIERSRTSLCASPLSVSTPCCRIGW